MPKPDMPLVWHEEIKIQKKKSSLQGVHWASEIGEFAIYYAEFSG